MPAATPDDEVYPDSGRVAVLSGYPAGMATYSAHDVAAEIRQRLPGVPTKKLHKLLYYCQGLHLATFGEPLFSETISAWDMGPVVGQLWFIEAQQGPAPIHRQLDESELNTVGCVLSRYGRLSGAELERLTHSEAPWQEADEARRASGERTRRIEPDAMESYFAAEADSETENDETALPFPDEAEVKAWLRGSEPRPHTERSWDTPESLLARLQ